VLSGATSASLEDVKGIVSGATPDETLTVENAVLLVDYVGRAGMADSLGSS